ncbi:MAG: nitronate monooxygenase, partial [Spirochaetota bacterium]|nr:nitronate monooxygenase [Spirochaetota bacterium]
MIRTKLCDLLGIEHPIIQAGMGPWKTEKLAIAAANSGILGIISTSGIVAELGEEFGIPTTKDSAKSKGNVDTPYSMIKQIILKVEESTRESKGIFGINCMVSAEMIDAS